MKRYSFADSLPEFHDLTDEDKKEAFRYSFRKVFRHGQTYLWLIIPVIIGSLLGQSFEGRVLQALIAGLTTASALTLFEYKTRPLFRKYTLDYIQLKRNESDQTFEEIISGRKLK